MCQFLKTITAGWHVSVVAVLYLVLVVYNTTTGGAARAIVMADDSGVYLVLGVMVEVLLRAKEVLPRRIPRQPERT